MAGKGPLHALSTPVFKVWSVASTFFTLDLEFQASSCKQNSFLGMEFTCRVAVEIVAQGRGTTSRKLQALATLGKPSLPPRRACNGRARNGRPPEGSPATECGRDARERRG